MKTKHIMFLALVTLLTTACSDDDAVRTSKDWDNTANFFQSSDADHFDTYYNPKVGYVGDPMPFFDPVAKDFKIFYLQEFRPNSATFHPFWCLSTTDAANYTSLGELIPTGTSSEMDGALGTGCTVYNDADQTYYTFYTGHSVNISATGLGEAVMVATSKDFKTWKKDRAFLLTGEGEYSTADFRDPCVFKDEAGEYHMVVSTQKDGKGVLAEYTSSNLKDWTSKGVFMSMMWDRFYECPDVFRMGDWWYLMYSEKHAAIRRVQYFKGKTIEDLKTCTLNDAGMWPDGHEGILDSRAFYAGKTASDGNERYVWGWCPTRPGHDNTNVGAYPAEPEWAGSLIAHKLIQHVDGTLSFGSVNGIENKFSSTVQVKVMDQQGNTSVGNGNYTLSGYSSILFGRLNECNKIHFTVKPNSRNDKFGISFVRGIDSKKYYTLVVNPEGDNRRKINFEQEGEEGIGFINGADGYVFDAPADNEYHISIFTDNSVCTVYINDNVAYTARIYGIQKNCWSINSYDDGSITIESLNIAK